MLPYDQIPPEQRTIVDYTARLGENNIMLATALARWMARNDAKAEPEMRQAANIAMASIDAMLAELHQLRARLVSEINESDDIAVARVDALLAEREAGQ